MKTTDLRIGQTVTWPVWSGATTTVTVIDIGRYHVTYRSSDGYTERVEATPYRTLDEQVASWSAA